jgi:hypothetical protein
MDHTIVHFEIPANNVEKQEVLREALGNAKAAADNSEKECS